MYNLNNDDFIDDNKEFEKDQKNTSNITFICPNCKKISRDDVIFLCNTCKQEELIYKDGVYMCPACLIPGENFECTRCGSKEVRMEMKKKKKSR
ncbi:hypothetical protein A2V49_04415 [candidate division WWE3 bacterium RBG_19FT_COMBO_34_6]|uniref:Uncharacterized protein n=1 Tax=candidate division WWE3 bacterium RBG_19FT_COMBO_34_6 TaxID=1802612 RepID=A0A1F4UMK1_UNCKA|nr:MAG: hypothetical protein A2V49_04415 [candidate division WWE3 bacterium RBG_19FT_COMBO_34_6]